MQFLFVVQHRRVLGLKRFIFLHKHIDMRLLFDAHLFERLYVGLLFLTHFFSPTKLISQHSVVLLQILGHVALALDLINDGAEVLKLHFVVRETARLVVARAWVARSNRGL